MSTLPEIPYYNTPQSDFSEFFILSDTRRFNNFILSDDFIDGVLRLFTNPSDYILNLRYYPFSVKRLLQTYSETDSLQIGGVPTNIIGTKVIRTDLNFIDFGEITVPNNNSFTDYSPYTKITLYLPFLGFQPLEVNSIIGETLHIKYAIDLFTGMCTAFIYIDDYLIETKSGKIATDIAIGGNNIGDIAKNLITTAVTTTGAVVAGVASGGLSLPAVATTLASTTASAIAGSREHITKNGINGGYLAQYLPTTPFIIIEKVNTITPVNYAHIYGRPCGETYNLGELEGYTKIASCHLDGFSNATNNELSEIETLLKQGVIL